MEDSILKLSEDGKTLLEVTDKNVTEVVIPYGVTTIGTCAFSFHNLQRIDIPDSVTVICGGAFFYCSALQSIEIPNSVTYIGQNAFDSCESLTSINIPNSVTSIGDCAFADCSSLQSIDIPNSVTDIAEDAFVYIDFEKCTLYIPSDAPKEFRQHPAFSRFKNIETVRYK